MVKPVLEREGVTIGAVTGVQGISWSALTLGGPALYVPGLQTDPEFGPFMRIDTMPDLPI